MRASQDSRADRDKSLLKDTHDSNNQNRKTKQNLAVFGEMMFSKSIPTIFKSKEAQDSKRKCPDFF